MHKEEVKMKPFVKKLGLILMLTVFVNYFIIGLAMFQESLVSVSLIPA